jgi:hypothetical protein
VEHWWTKTNAYDVTVGELTDTKAVIEFTTAWAPPIPVITALSKKNPTLTMTLTSCDDQLQDVHTWVFTAGVGKLRDCWTWDWDGICHWSMRGGVEYDPPMLAGFNGVEPAEEPDFDMSIYNGSSVTPEELAMLEAVMKGPQEGKQP